MSDDRQQLELSARPMFVCEECGAEWQTDPRESYEDDDADGNRGRWMCTIICPECQEESCWYR